jgi:uncharacterized damage-inducible protein DinB
MSMPRKPYVERMAEYNGWMNVRVYAAAGRLSGEALARDRQAFFGSILGTLNHLVVADTIWLQRFAGIPGPHAALDEVRAMPRQMPMALDAIPFPDFDALSAHRTMLDATIERWAASLTEDDLRHVLHYSNTRGESFEREVFGLLMHFFNHQTHHRGQATTLLTQAGVDVGVTDLLVLIPDAHAAASAIPHPS